MGKDHGPQEGIPPQLNFPSEVLSKFKAIIALTDAFCKRHLNEEYVRDVSAACDWPWLESGPRPLPEAARKSGRAGSSEPSVGRTCWMIPRVLPT